MSARAELIVDSFAGGGGTSEGIRLALGRDPDIAINHDAAALAMHRINHPGTRHMVEDVWNVDARRMCDGRPIGLLWLSPDCKHFSKAKGGKPRNKDIRGLAWVGLSWVKSLPRAQRPRVIILENVEEFQDWGPLLEDGRPCQVQKGATFKTFLAGFASLGYAAEWRELRACDHGDPTIRKRLFVVMRRDGRPIVWPARTHGNPKDAGDAALIARGWLKPWRTAAEIIDFSLPCPSIFETSAEIKDKLGLRANRPLADNTMSRVAKGTMRYVVNAAQPFIVPVTHAGDDRVHGVDEPLRTITTARRGEHALVTPFVTKFNRGATGQSVEEPLATVTAHTSETHGGGAAPLGLVAPLLVRTAHGEVDAGGHRRGRGDHAIDDPMPTILASNDSALVAPFLVPRYGERPGQEPRTRGVDDPAPVIVPTANEGSLATVELSKPELVAAFLAQHNTDMVGHDIREPVSTIVDKGCTQGLVQASFLSHAYTSNTAGGNGDLERPLKTTLAGGQHAALVAAFLAKYYGAGEPVQAADDPLHTVTAKPRHGLVCVTICGTTYVITDIGMRMLTPRERFSAQGFGPQYTIDHGLREDGTVVAFTLEQQGRMCGNSVCPGMARALVAANYVPAEAARPSRRVDRAIPLLEAAE